MSRGADVSLRRADFRPERAGMRSEGADFKPKRADMRLERVDFKP